MSVDLILLFRTFQQLPMSQTGKVLVLTMTFQALHTLTPHVPPCLLPLCPFTYTLLPTLASDLILRHDTLGQMVISFNLDYWHCCHLGALVLYIPSAWSALHSYLPTLLFPLSLAPKSPFIRGCIRTLLKISPYLQEAMYSLSPFALYISP